MIFVAALLLACVSEINFILLKKSPDKRLFRDIIRIGMYGSLRN